MAVITPTNRVLLVPEGSLYLAFRLPRLLKDAGWPVDLLGLRGEPMARSRYVSASILENDPEALLGRLQSLLRQPEHPWRTVVVAHEATARRLIAGADTAFLQSWQPGALDPQVREFFLSKFGLEAVTRSGRLMVPPARVCRSAAEIAEFGRVAGWPLIVKPPDGSGGSGVLKFASPEELESKHGSLTLPVLAQKFIPGRRGVVDMLCAAGQPLAWLASYSTKRRQGEFGASTARLFRAMPALEPLVRQVAEFTRFEGFCGFDWIEEEGTGRHYLIEFHPRPSSGFRFGGFCGVDFVPAIATWLKRNGEEAKNFPTQVQPPGRAVAAHYFSGDLTRCLRERDWRGLKHWLPGSGAVHDFFWDDPKLLAAWLLQSGRRWCKSRLPG